MANRGASARVKRDFIGWRVVLVHQYEYGPECGVGGIRGGIHQQQRDAVGHVDILHEGTRFQSVGTFYFL